MRSLAMLAPPRSGEVVLVGAGPGDPGLITWAGIRALRVADVVVHDRLISPRLLEEASPAAQRVDVGKSPAGRSTAQETIHQVLIEAAQGAQRVVRLKGGDSFLFGRGAEEIQALWSAGIPARWIPGVSSALSAPAVAGIPVTHRSVAHSLTILTGHRVDGELEDLGDLVAADTLVILMGVRSLEGLRDQLLAHGRPSATPAALIERATWSSQGIVRSTLEEIVEVAAREGVRPPAVLVVGAVVDLLADHGPIWSPVHGLERDGSWPATEPRQERSGG